MKIDPEVVTMLSEIPWFTNCGRPLTTKVPFAVRYVGSWSEAEAACAEPTWEDVTLEAQNRLTSFLHEKYRSQYAEWNQIVKEAKAIMEMTVRPALQGVCLTYGLGKNFVDSVEWDILGAVMEKVYSVRGRPTFALDLLAVYQSGNFPCGWEGEWPEGRLIVY